MELLVVVKAYPNPSQKYGETACVAGVELDPEPNGWIRLYPIPFRTLEKEKKFRKYEVISVDAMEAVSDYRRETRRPNLETLRPTGRVLSTANDWRERRSVVEPLIEDSMCAIARRQQESGQSIGIFRPALVEDLEIIEVDVAKEKELLAEAAVAQGSILDEADMAFNRRAIELLPYAFKYRYRCSDPECRGHTQTIVDWEMGQHFRNVRARPDWRDLLRKRWLDEICGDDKDTAFIVGNQFQGPVSFLVLGVWRPPKLPDQLRMA
jgi:hypothetical protein